MIMFNIMLVLFMVPCYLLALIASCTTKCCKEFRLPHKLVYVTTCLAWRCTLCLSCWIRRRMDGHAEFKAQFGNAGRPTILITNHTSFLDTIQLVAAMPLNQVFKVRMMVSDFLLKMPALGTIVRAMGHIAIPFKGGKGSDNMELDKDLLVERQKEFENHVMQGGIGAWYPEGKMGDSTDLAQFRAGGFVLAVDNDVEIWCAAHVGNSVCWPRKATVGGRPCRIGFKLFKLCDSSHDFVKDAGDARARAVFLANASRDRIQQAVNELVADGFVASKSRAGDAKGDPKAAALLQ